MADEKKFILWGSSGHAKVLASLIKSHGWSVVAFFDNNPKAIAAIPDVPLYIGRAGFLSWCKQQPNLSDTYGLAAIGGACGADRLEIHKLFKDHQIRVEPLVHSQASVCSTAQLGAGTQILAQSVVSSDAVVGEACIINHGASVDHESTLGEGVHLAPHATICGCVTIGRNTMVGAGAVILPRLIVGDNVIIGAGAIVTKDLPSEIVVTGNPARAIR